MTLIIKELIIKGIVSNEHSFGIESSINKDAIQQSLEEIKSELMDECYEKLLQKLQTTSIR